MINLLIAILIRLTRKTSKKTT